MPWPPLLFLQEKEIWTKAELQAIVEDFPKVTKDPHRFAEEFNVAFQTYQPGFSDLHQLVHILVGRMQITNWENAERSLELQPRDQPTDSYTHSGSGNH